MRAHAAEKSGEQGEDDAFIGRDLIVLCQLFQVSGDIVFHDLMHLHKLLGCVGILVDEPVVGVIKHNENPIAHVAELIYLRPHAWLLCQLAGLHDRLGYVSDSLGLMDDADQLQTEHHLALRVIRQVLQHRTTEILFALVDGAIQLVQVAVEDFVFQRKGRRGSKHRVPRGQHSLDVAKSFGDERRTVLGKEIE